MKRIIKKWLVYLVVTTLAVPVSLVTGFATAKTAKAAEPKDVVINEFYVSSGEWVELWNKTDEVISLEGWTIKDLANSARSLTSLGEVPADSITVYNVSGSWLNDKGTEKETITLFDNEGNQVDTVSYGTDLTVDVVAPGGGQSACLDSEGNWTIVEYPTKGLPNDIVGKPVAPVLASVPSPTNNKKPELRWDPIESYPSVTSYTLSIDGKAVYQGMDLSHMLADDLTEGGHLWSVFAHNDLGDGSVASSNFVVDTTAPSLNMNGVTARIGSGSTVNLNGDESSGYTLNTDREASTEYLLQLSEGTTVSEPLDFTDLTGLYLDTISTTVSSADLIAYYNSRSMPSDYRDYLISAANGEEPFTLFDGENVKIVDAARYELVGSKTDMAIPGDYPIGTYVVKGDIKDIAGNVKTVSFKLVVAGKKTESPVVTLLGEPVIAVNNGSLYSDAGATALGVDGIADLTNEVSVTGLPIDTSVPGEYVVTYTLEESGVSRKVIVLTPDKTVVSPSTNLSGSVTTGVIQPGTTNDSSVIVSGDTAGRIDGSMLLIPGATPSVKLDGAIDVTKTITGIGDVVVQIPATTIKASDPLWNGTINLPTISTSTVPVVPDANKSATVISVIEIGFDDTSLTFENPVRILIPGQSGKSVGYIRSGIFTPITTECLADSQASVEAQLAGGYGDCKKDVGADLVIWTKHFTKFITYDQTLLPLIAPTITASSTEHDGNKYVKVSWQGIGRGVDQYVVVVNGVTATTLNVSTDDFTVSYNQEIKISGSGNYDVYVKALRGTEVVTSLTKTVVITAIIPATTVSTTSAAPTNPLVQSAKAQQSAPAVTTPAPSPQTPEEKKLDDQGQIKGDEEENDEGINWTPWIILFALIILAGAATGGYFYWFSGREEVAAAAPPVSKAKADEGAKVVVKEKKSDQSNTKKPKRW
ncbi:MAG TPA: DUF5011 domain-containing protein [bacterium]|nr:DUF5011 domain-containing protein [bacterium]